MPTSVYLPNSAGCMAYSHALETIGTDTGKSPGDKGLTPALIMSQGDELSSSILDALSLDDLGGVQISVTKAGTGTRTLRANLLFSFHVDLAENMILTMNMMTKYSHRVTVSGVDRDLMYEHRMYVWNDDASFWTNFDSSATTGVQELTQFLASNMARFVEDGTGNLYLLVWDYEGTVDSVSGGGGGKEDNEVVPG